MKNLKKYKNSIWRVPLVAAIAGFLYTPIYVRIVIQFGVIEPGVIDSRVSLMTSLGILAAVLILCFCFENSRERKYLFPPLLFLLMV